MFLTAGLFGWAFALIRVLAGLLAACLGAVLVIASEAWGDPDVPSSEGGDAGEPAVISVNTRRKMPPGWRRARLAFRIARRRWKSKISTSRLEGGPDTGTKKGRVVWSLLKNAAVYGFGDLLDEVAWPVLFGFLLSGFLAALLPADLASRIPGGLTGQIVFAALVAIPLNVCASGTIPLAAVLVSGGLFPAAALVIFLTGPLTNPASLLVLRRHFGRKFIQSLLISCFSVAIAFAFVLHSVRRSLQGPGYTGEPLLTGNASGGEIFFGTVFGALFLLSLMRVGLQRGSREIGEALGGIVPSAARRRVGKSLGKIWARPGRIMAAGGLLAAILWLSRGMVSVPPGSVALRQTLGQTDRAPLSAGWRWSLPPPFGNLKIVPMGRMLKVDIGFRAGRVSDIQGLRWDPFSEYWHSIYTTTGDNPSESSFVTGDQNLVEVKAALHLTVRDPYQLALRTRDGVEAVRAPFLNVMSRLLATREVDRSLTEDRGDLEEKARGELQTELDRGNIPLEVRAVNILDFHPPQETVSAFRDVGSAAEEKERRIFEARGKLDSALPLARGKVATDLAAARSERAEKVLQATGEKQSFDLQAQAAADQPSAARLRAWWNTTERVLKGRPKVLLPANALPEILDWGPSPRSDAPQKGPSPP